LSHDLRSPVANLISFLNLQKEAPELVTKEIKERNDKKIIESAENLIETMESMLLWSKGQMQNFKPQKQEILIKDVFSYLQKFFENATEAQITFENPQNLSVISDIDFLKIIMQNLTLNATKALSGKPNAQIVWTVQKENNHILLSIKDNGPGLSQKQIDTLYLDQSTIGSKSGLGLHLIRDLTKAIDCTFKIAYTSDAGSEFQLIFG
jgi:K+-sensing histidine kinase KdpD